MRAWAVWAVIAAGCGSAAPAGSVADEAGKDAAVDSNVAEIAGEVSGDVAVDGAVDAAVDTGACTKIGGLACQCLQNSDCDSGFCVETDNGKACAPPNCNCPDGETCDAVGQCTSVPAYPSLCKPCSADTDCQTGGKTDAFCLPLHTKVTDAQFLNGSFCGAACTVSTNSSGSQIDSCPSGYTCATVKLVVNGQAVKQCIPVSGECSCHDDWAQAGLSTPCSKENGMGKCVSTRQCAVDGSGKTVLTVCSAPTPATEVCGDAIDNDCNGKTDEENSVGCGMQCPDSDKDGYGAGGGKCVCGIDPDTLPFSCDDCNDGSGTISPGKVEICNNLDDNCNGETDESGSKGCTVFFADADGDGFGNSTQTACLCKVTGGWTSATGDCNDAPGSGFDVHPGAEELCNGIDDNCNGKIDEQDATGCLLYFVDQDGDGYGVTSSGLCLCAPSKTHTALVGGDCEDTSGTINPGNTELCDGIDNDCSGITDDGSANSTCKSGSCVNGSCGSTCPSGSLDLNGSASDGCECTVLSENSGDTCGSAVDLGPLTSGGSVQASGQIVPGDNGDWFRMQAPNAPVINSCNDYSIHGEFLSNPDGFFVFDVFRGSCSVSNQICSGETVHDWSVDFSGPWGTNKNAGECPCAPSPGMPGVNTCVNHSSTYYVRIRRQPDSPVTCATYSLQFKSGGLGIPPGP